MLLGLSIAIIAVALSNLWTAYANYRTHCNLVRALEAQQTFNDSVVEFEQRVAAWATSVTRRDA